jgi:hypothetical protein
MKKARAKEHRLGPAARTVRSEKMSRDKSFVLELNLTGRHLAFLLVTLLLASIALRLATDYDSAAANPELVTGQRRFYITDLAHQPNQALTACDAGYHFASLWEIIDPSSLQYDTILGQTTLDSGDGPPTTLGLGWVRTGYNFADVTTAVGHANCNLWASNSNNDYGTVAVLPQIWTSGAQDLNVWDVDVRTCNFTLGVWCVED